MYFYISALQGTELEFSGLAIEFRVDTAKTTYCQVCHLSGFLTFSLAFCQVTLSNTTNVLLVLASVFSFHSRFQVNLDPGVLKTFLYAVKNHYWYQMYLDDLPIWGIVGEIEEKGQDFYIWTHKKFEIGWNGDQIVDVNLTSEGRTKLHLSTEKLEFTYEVSLLNFSI